MKMQDQSQEIRKNLITDTVTYINMVKKNYARNIEIANTPFSVQSCNFSCPQNTST